MLESTPNEGDPMRHTNRETSTHTLTRLIKALDAGNPVTITYTKADGTETIRTIEIYDVTVSSAGDILLKAMDRETGESRTFRLDRLVAYTIHRSAYVVARPAADDKPARTTGLATVTVLYPVDLPITERIALLADALAA
ncbi:WYL domain-containing protein [Streptomyces sp. WAC02707]|nr:WYL domain-containing protein [Streptomyces sp. WAC02707]